MTAAVDDSFLLPLSAAYLTLSLDITDQSTY